MYGSVLGWRFFVTTSLLGLALGFRWYFGDSPDSPRQYALFLFVACEYLFSGVYLILGRWDRWRKSEKALALQLILDLVFVSVILIYTGGLYSNFWVLYSFVAIIAVGLLSPQLGIPLMALSVSVPVGMALLHWFTGYRIHGHSPDVLRDLITRTSYNSIVLLFGSVAGQFLGERVRRTALALKESEKDNLFLQSVNNLIVENIPSGLLVLDQEGSMLTANQAATQILGANLKLAIAMFDQKEGGQRNEITLDSGEETSIIGYASVPTALPDGATGTIILFQDLTSYKQLENQLRREEKLAAIGRLGANLAHEIRNPLAGISNAFELLQDDLPAGSSKAMRGIIEREMNRLQNLLDNFLSYTSPATRTPTVFVPGSLAADLIRTGYSETTLHRSPDGDWTVYGYPDIFLQALHNLLRNAYQWVPKTNRRICCTLSKKKEGLEVVVEDNGPGIPEIQYERIWEPFQSGHAQGSGLGLAIISNQIADIGGLYEVDRSPTLGGARFRLFFNFPLSADHAGSKETDSL